MKLFIIDKVKNQKTYLRAVATNRKELSRSLGASLFSINGNLYSVNDVHAEPSSDSTTVGGLLGGIIGAAGGAPGVLVGGALGALIGQSQTEKERKEAEVFNGSQA